MGSIILQYLSRWNKISQKSFLNINICRLPRPSIRFRLVLCDNKPSLLAVHRNFIPCVKSCPFQSSAPQKNLRRSFFKSTPSFINCHSAFFHLSSLSVASLHTISNTFPLSVLTAIRLFCSSAFISAIPIPSLSFSKSKSLSLKQFKSILLFLLFIFYSLLANIIYPFRSYCNPYV